MHTNRWLPGVVAAVAGLWALGTVVAADPTSTAPPTQVVIKECLVSLIDDVNLSTEEPGLLVAIKAREGAQVKAGDLLAQMNDSQARHAMNVAEAEYRAAKVKADNDVNTRYARAAHAVAEKEHETARLANDKVPGTKSYVELQKLGLQVKQAELQIEQSQHEANISGAEAEARKAKMDSASNDMKRRQIVAPINGEVVEVSYSVGEWLQAGDKLMRVVRLDRLRVEGFVSAKEVLPGEIDKRQVTIEVELARGRIERFDGEVVYVNPLVQPGGDYRVRAEVTNRQENGQWLLRPGTEALLTIKLGARATPASAQLAK